MSPKRVAFWIVLAASSMTIFVIIGIDIYYSAKNKHDIDASETLTLTVLIAIASLLGACELTYAGIQRSTKAKCGTTVANLSDLMLAADREIRLIARSKQIDRGHIIDRLHLVREGIRREIRFLHTHLALPVWRDDRNEDDKELQNIIDSATPEGQAAPASPAATLLAQLSASSESASADERLIQDVTQRLTRRSKTSD